MCGENEAESGMALGKIMMIYVFVNKEKTASRLGLCIFMYYVCILMKEMSSNQNFCTWKKYDVF